MLRANKIEPKEYYTLTDIVAKKLLPTWRTSHRGVRGIVIRDMSNKNILKTVVEGDGRSKKYHIKGENIIKFIKAVETGKVTI